MFHISLNFAGAESSTRVPCVCPRVRTTTHAHTRARAPRTGRGTLQRNADEDEYALLCDLSEERGLHAAEIFVVGGTFMESNEDPTARLR
jgi:hypothetical protein